MERIARIASQMDAAGRPDLADRLDARIAMSREAQWGGYGYEYPMIIPSYKQMKMDRDEMERDREEQKRLRAIDPNVTLWDRFEGMLAPDSYNRRTRRELREKGIIPQMQQGDQAPATQGWAPPSGVRPGPGGERVGPCPYCGAQKLFGVPPIACPNCGQGGPQPGMMY